MKKWRDVKQGKFKNSQQTSCDTSLHIAQIAPRVKAFLTDTFLITTPIFYLVIYVIIGSLQEFAENRAMGWGFIFLFHFIIIAFFWIKKSQTPGLKAYELKLVNKKGNHISLFQAVIRYIATLFAVTSIFLLFIPFFRKDKQTFQDIFSNTHIVCE